ncbi:unnamed protein product [Orchesella dallaii]|uniref:F-box domain-containing protein n=1 Tax=Orchesella dallaii TaxID=48710 RepID=A0ABP1Q2B3_9HEXA
MASGILSTASIHSFLSSIPSQASELAVTAVNSYIEDQVKNPENFARGINRVRSAFAWRTNTPQRNGGDGGGDCRNVDKTELLTIPRKIRQKIWQHLDDNSVRTMRLICQQLRHEMDYDVGLSIILNNESFSNLWMRSISIRTCIVKKMDNCFTLNLMAKPDKLEKISFDSELYIDADIAQLIIRKFQNLRQLIMYTDDVSELFNEYDEASSNGLSSNVITRLDDQFQLTSIDVKFDTSKWKLKWNIKMKPQIFEKYWAVQDIIGPFGTSGITHVPARDLSRKSLKNVTLSIPFVQNQDRLVWLKVLASQNQLSSLTCDLNATHWKEYEAVIRANYRTLKKLFLLNITCYTVSVVPCESHLVQKQTEESPLDWKVFEGCNALEDFTLIADTFVGAAEACSRNDRCCITNINVDSLKCPNLKTVWLENFKFSEEQAAILQYDSVESKENARFELCTLKNCMIGETAVVELQLGSKKERQRSLECLCFGTVSYDDDDVDSFEKYAAKMTQPDLQPEDEFFMKDYFQLMNNSSALHSQRHDDDGLGVKLMKNMNIIGGVAFTCWLALC